MWWTALIAQGFTLMATVPLGEPTDGVRLQGDYLWVGGVTHLYAVDVLSPAAPVVLDSVPSGAIVDLAPSGTDVVVTVSPDSGMQVWYVWNPSQIQPAYTAGVPAGAVDVRGVEAYVATSTALEAWDVTNPYGPYRMGSWSGSLTDLRVWGDFLYATDGTETLRVLNITNPGAITEVGQAVLGGRANRVEMDTLNLLVFAGTESGVEIWDVNTPTAPQRLASCPATGAVEGLRYRTPQYLFVVILGEGLTVLDLSDPTRCTPVGQVAGSFAGVEVGTFSLNEAFVYTTGNLTQIWRFSPVGVEEFPSSPSELPSGIRLAEGRIHTSRPLLLRDALGRAQRLAPGDHRLAPGVYMLTPLHPSTPSPPIWKIWVP